MVTTIETILILLLVLEWNVLYAVVLWNTEIDELMRTIKSSKSQLFERELHYYTMKGWYDKNRE